MLDKTAGTNENPIRVQLLQQGAALTSGDRDVSYGDPVTNLGLAGSLKNLCEQFRQRHLSPAEQEAMEQVLTKVARVYTGLQVKPDNYIDGATYFAIAGEAALRDLEVQPKTDRPTSEG